MTFKFVSVLAVAATLGACEAYADGHASAPAQVQNGILVDAKGMSLYTFDNDAAGVSNCNGGCAASWPPLMAKAGAEAPEGYSIITRKGGDLQWAYQDQPLYLWIQDRKVGQTTGDGVGGVWHLARP